MTYGQEHTAVDCILQTYVPGNGRGRDSVRCEFLFADCIPSHQCPERLRLCADLAEQREREDREWSARTAAAIRAKGMGSE